MPGMMTSVSSRWMTFFMRDGDLHGDCAVGGLDDFVALLFEILAREVTQVGFVLDQQDGFGAGFDCL